MERVTRKALSIPITAEVSLEEKARLSNPESVPQDRITDQSHKKIPLRQLINKLNNLNFQDQTVTVVFRHRTYPKQRLLEIKAYPQPCLDARLVCRWAESLPFDRFVEVFQFENLLISNGERGFEVIPDVNEINEEQITFSLPETCREIGTRVLHPHPSTGITAYLFQNGVCCKGVLIDYGTSGFRVGVRLTAPQSFGWIEDNDSVTIVFAKGGQTLYSGICRIVGHDRGIDLRHYLLEPVQGQIRRFSPREFRSTRHQLPLAPDVVFEHPLIEKRIILKVHDLSGSGFSVEEEACAAVLIPGLIIPDLELVFRDGSCIRCLAQVLACNPCQDGNTEMVRAGMVILNIALNDHMRLQALMHQAIDAQAYVCNKVDMAALWDFFFETGFIYPQKYKFLQENKGAIKATYEKLYRASPSVASHFIYQRHGRILAHMATVRFYESSWMIHHHAAIRSSQNKGGLVVLNQAGTFFRDSHRLPYMKMDYIFCYYRPNNKFPAKVFGGSARSINIPKVCSVDVFAYFHHSRANHNRSDLPNHWTIEEIYTEDLHHLRIFYEKHSGGLMIDALHLNPENIDCSDLKATFHQMGLKRDRHLYSLRYRGQLQAILVINLADIGLNMSDLTNCMTIIVIDDHHLTCDLMETAVGHLDYFYENDTVPVLLYPEQAAHQMGIKIEKQYCLWAYSWLNPDYYFRYIKRLLKFM